MGGRVALEVLRLAPERVERLALLDTGTHPIRAGEAEGRYALRDLGRDVGIAALVDAWLPPMVHPARRDDHGLLQPMRDMAMAGGVDRYERQISALLNRPDTTPELAHIACPTLVATGAQDNWSTPAQHQEIAAAIPGSIFRIFAHCGHMAPLEAPDHVNAAIAEWLNLPINEKERL
jgi:pimeloyl-ACP methyl ester carboxylesterase